MIGNAGCQLMHQLCASCCSLWKCLTTQHCRPAPASPLLGRAVACIVTLPSLNGHMPMASCEQVHTLPQSSHRGSVTRDRLGRRARPHPARQRPSGARCSLDASCKHRSRSTGPVCATSALPPCCTPLSTAQQTACRRRWWTWESCPSRCSWTATPRAAACAACCLRALERGEQVDAYEARGGLSAQAGAGRHAARQSSACACSHGGRQQDARQARAER